MSQGSFDGFASAFLREKYEIPSPQPIGGTIYLRFRTINSYYHPIIDRRQGEEEEEDEAPCMRCRNWIETCINETSFTLARCISWVCGEIVNAELFYRPAIALPGCYKKLRIRSNEPIQFIDLFKTEESTLFNRRKWIVYQRTITTQQQRLLYHFLSNTQNSTYNTFGQLFRWCGCLGQRGKLYKPVSIDETTLLLTPSPNIPFVMEWFDTELITCILIYLGIFDADHINPARSNPTTLLQYISLERNTTNFFPLHTTDL
jgi:hypothetical protein